MSVRRFPTLDSWGSALDGAGSGKPLQVQRCDSLAALAAQRVTHTFGSGSSDAAVSSGEAPAAGPMPPLVGRGLRKRQLSSRRTLMATLSRDNSAASSMDLQPQGKTRHVMEAESGGNSPDRTAPFGCALPALAMRPLHRSGSTLGREAAAAAAAMAAEAAKAIAAAPADMLSPAATPTAQHSPPAFFCGAAAGDCEGSCGSQPGVPLLARMTCLKVRDTE